MAAAPRPADTARPCPRKPGACADFALRPNVVCDLFARSFSRHESVTFSRISVQYAALVRARELHHDRFGSRRDPLRHAGVRPCGGAGRRQGLQTRRTGRFGDQAGGPDQERGGAGRQNPQPPCGPTPIPPSSATISAPACRSSARSRPPRPRTPATGCGSPAPSSKSRPPIRANRPSFWSGPRPRPISPISAPAIRRARADALAVLGQSHGRAQTVAAGAGCAAAVARPARGRRRARPNTRRCATSTGSGCSITPSDFGFRLAAGLLPVLRGPGQTHRFRAVPGAGRQRQAGAVGGRPSALRRRLETWRALQHQSARRAAVDGEGKPAEIGRVQHLCARPQAVRALYRARLCAAAHRPARHSRWSASIRPR